jgi:hypothetical protein
MKLLEFCNFKDSSINNIRKMKNHHTFRCIGKGCCGSIWALNNDSDWVVKREDGGDRSRSITNDQIMHRKVIAAVTESEEVPVRIPKSYEIIEADDPWWAANLQNFPNGTTSCKAYMQERIPAVPHEIRELLISRYCRPNGQAAIRASQENKDCLIRIYTGKRRLSDRLHVDQMDELGLDTSAILRVLATALAHCYWRTRVDANDVEFVFAPATASYASTPTFKIAGVELAIWRLDYDCVRDMEQSTEGIQQAVNAFHRNDSYFPRPHFSGHTEADVRLWERFKMDFLAASNDVLRDVTLAEEWMRQADEEGRRRAANGTPCWCVGGASGRPPHYSLWSDSCGRF